ncbi:Serine hydroxymethyltransferase, cytosolic, partial [Friedmanniomyces endolithicus]
GLDGARVEAVLEQVNIACNKNTTPGDKSALSPCGIRIGAPAMTSRGMGEEDFERIAGYIDRCVKMAKEIQGGLPKEGNKLKDFKEVVGMGRVEGMAELKKEIAGWAGTFPLPV